MDDNQFQMLLNYLGYSRAGYRRVKKGVKKRIRRHMQQLGCRDIAAYLKTLTQQTASRQECELLMTVSISRFFRDRPLWEMLESRLLPDMIADHVGSLRVWSAGCACGEEVYSFKIVWQGLRNRLGSMPPMEILATDRHPQYIGRAQSGIYNRSSLREVPDRAAAVFFRHCKKSGPIAVIEDLKGNIRWEVGNLLDDAPQATFDLIFLRNNVLTYCRQKDQIRVLSGIVESLDPGGLLIIGSLESLPFETAALVPTGELPYVFRKK